MMIFQYFEEDIESNLQPRLFQHFHGGSQLKETEPVVRSLLQLSLADAEHQLILNLTEQLISLMSLFSCLSFYFFEHLFLVMNGMSIKQNYNAKQW